MAPITRFLQRRWTLIVPVVAGMTVLVLAIGVYTMAARASTTNEQAAALHLADESIRSIEIADARARQIVLLTLLSGDGVEVASSLERSRADFDLALDDAELGLTALRTLAPDDASSALLSAASEDLVAASAGLDDVVRSVDADDQAGALERLSTAVVGPLGEAAGHVAVDRDHRIDELDATADALQAVATLVGFIVAFIVPTVAVVTYRVATRPGRDEALLRTSVVDLDERLADLGRGAEDLTLGSIISPLRDAVAGRDPSAVHPGIGQASAGAERLLLLLRSTNGSIVARPEAVDLARLATDVGAHHDLPVSGSGGRVVAIADPQLLRWSVQELIANAVRHGHAPALELATDGARASLVVVDRGAGLPAEVAEIVFGRRSSDAKRRARRGEQATGLLLVAHLADRMGGALTHERRGNETRVRFDLPASSDLERLPSPDARRVPS